MPRSRKHRNRRVVTASALVAPDCRVLARYEVLRTGVVRVTGGREVSPAERERAADWLADVFPDKSHDERYVMLWG